MAWISNLEALSDGQKSFTVLVKVSLPEACFFIHSRTR